MNEKNPTPDTAHEDAESSSARVLRLRKEVTERVDRSFVFSEALISFVKKIQERHPDYMQRLVYHALIGSSPMEGAVYLQDDFPGEDSVIAFLERLLEGH